MERTEKIILEQLRAGNEKAYKFLYDNHYPVLCHLAARYVHDDFLAETIVGDIIFHLWEIRASLNVETSLRSYLVRCVRNRCLDYLKSQHNQREVSINGIGSDDMPVVGYIHNDDYPLGRLLEQELEGEIMRAIGRLPEECRRVFRLSRMEGKKNDEIAAELNISINTVRYHIKHALTLLNGDLRKYLISLILVFINN